MNWKKYRPILKPNFFSSYECLLQIIPRITCLHIYYVLEQRIVQRSFGREANPDYFNQLSEQ